MMIYFASGLGLSGISRGWPSAPFIWKVGLGKLHHTAWLQYMHAGIPLIAIEVASLAQVVR